MNIVTLDLWIVAAIAAAGFQTLRFVLQKVLSTEALSPTGATFARFVYSAPIVVFAVFIYLSAGSVPFPGIAKPFWIYAVVGGFAQSWMVQCC